MAYAFMTRHQDEAGRHRIDGILRGPKAAKPQDLAAANRQALTALSGYIGKAG